MYQVTHLDKLLEAKPGQFHLLKTTQGGRCACPLTQVYHLFGSMNTQVDKPKTRKTFSAHHFNPKWSFTLVGCIINLILPGMLVLTAI